MSIKIKKSSQLLLVIIIILVSFNLRAPLTSVGPIIHFIQKEFLLNNSMAGLLTTLPLIVFGIISLFVSKISAKFGSMRTLISGLVLILIGEAIRSYTGLYGLFIGTGILGIGIAVGNVLIPSFIKQKFSAHIGPITSLYATSMCLSAALGAGLSAPLILQFNFDWRDTLFIWSVLAVITIATMFFYLIKNKPAQLPPKTATPELFGINEKSIWKSPLAWWVTLFMGAQSLVFYSLAAWLPSMITSKGMGVEFAGLMCLVYQLMAIPATLIIPVLAGRRDDQRKLTTIKIGIYLLGILLLFFTKSKTIILLSVVLMGIGMGGSISLAIAFISLRTPNAKKTTQLSGMSQSFGYFFAALGPFLLGFMYDVTQSWDLPIISLVTVLILLAFFGLKAGANNVTHD
ncbi:MFS transporter, CP family, cyanate transporter [Maridesulfovibrio ferrireducens]|uniref:MFS transporter, CP family, cyanate transporter n=1 Tax=Maridesulfovibrio ferrireducens TaxID=246191 RepID=A0A1G9KLB9_9BACT|nr:MFS transporter [Maridesulfovibrio ferrireducens]SDL50452.1 MFS transporter, CP family, cyanate transporter [Maridesulfovibrio ferrireducens]